MGHILRQKEYTGDQYETIDMLTRNPRKGNYYLWRYLDKCPRCGKRLCSLTKWEIENVLQATKKRRKNNEG